MSVNTPDIREVWNSVAIGSAKQMPNTNLSTLTVSPVSNLNSDGFSTVGSSIGYEENLQMDIALHNSMKESFKKSAFTPDGDHISELRAKHRLLKVITLSDLTKPNKQLLTAARDVLRYQSLSSECYEWPEQPKPSNKIQQTWRKALNRLELQTHQENKTYKYEDIRPKANQVSSWRYDRKKDEIWPQEDIRWIKLTSKQHKTQRRIRNIFQRHQGAHMVTEIHWTIAIVHSAKDGEIQLHNVLPRTAHTTKTDARDTWVHLANINKGEPLQRFIQEIEQGTDACVSDGSAKDGVGSAGYKSMHQEEELPAFQGAQKVPGRQEDMHSY